MPRLPSVLLGVGLGGFIDGIVLHQILQWHHLLSDAGEDPATVAGLEANTLADGFFHLATWVVVIVATTMLVSAWQRGELAPPWRVHVGLALIGWGLFNLVEGIVDHHLLTLHHVQEGANQTAWDLAFLAFGAALVGAGMGLAGYAKTGRERQVS